MINVQGLTILMLAMLSTSGVVVEPLEDETLAVNVIKQNATWAAPCADGVGDSDKLEFSVLLTFTEGNSAQCDFAFGTSLGDKATDLAIAEQLVQHTELCLSGIGYDPENMGRVDALIEVTKIDRGLYVALVHPRCVGDNTDRLSADQPAALAIDGDTVTLLRPVAGIFSFH